ncbi:hypothetical protein [Actinomyces sp. MRS3W]|uniref:hypothetical protein n=1 Tax=Actinomyces sp. MRS3W TaxID=2800796 RepID=UPI0028FDBDD3|nr:hypothetical protein [Actinomyces sp. MRS3W]MDU0348123.1 hypothetical protein [Actinomyces sp. MRS3W]
MARTGPSSSARSFLARFRRSVAIPPTLAALVPSDGPLLGAVPLDADGSRWAAATARYLTVVGADGVELHRGWHEVERGRWDAEAATFTLTWTDAARAPLELVVPAAVVSGEGSQPVDVARFARALRQGVESALVHSATDTLPGGRRVTVSVRRDARWGLYTASSLPDDVAAGLDAADQAALADLNHRVRDGVGLPTN